MSKRTHIELNSKSRAVTGGCNPTNGTLERTSEEPPTNGERETKETEKMPVNGPKPLQKRTSESRFHGMSWMV